MAKIIFTYGTIAGLIIAIIMFGSMAIWGTTDDIAGSEWMGYSIMLLALSMIFFGIKSYRDNQLGGVIKFWTGLKLGLGISLVAGILYVAGWEVYFQTSARDFMDQYTESYIEKLKEEGVSPEEIVETRLQMEQFKELYDITIARIGITLMEILPVGIVLSLISAGLLRKSTFLPAEALQNDLRDSDKMET